MFIYIKIIFNNLLDFCRKDLSDENLSNENSYKETCEKIPSRYIHHLEDPEDYYYHPFEF